MSELNPCKFCGGNITMTYEEDQIYRYRCDKCGAVTCREDKSRASAIAAWNCCAQAARENSEPDRLMDKRYLLAIRQLENDKAWSPPAFEKYYDLAIAALYEKRKRESPDPPKGERA